MPEPAQAFAYLFGRDSTGPSRLLSRWLFLRAFGFVYASAFFALLFQVKGLIGRDGILPAHEFLEALQHFGGKRFLDAPSLLWLSSSDVMLMTVCWLGLIASVLVMLNVWPRFGLLVCFVCFLSFVAVSQDFGQYQSDGMLLEAGFLSLFIAPKGVWPGLGRSSPPIRAAWFLLLWEWFRIYFQSGVVKLASGDPTWRNLTAMYEYYQNGPLPTWAGWYLQHLPHWFHIATAAATLVMELIIVWLFVLGPRWRFLCFLIVTVWQAGVILTANYAFLNYLVLFLGILLLDDRYLERLVPTRWGSRLDAALPLPETEAPTRVGTATILAALMLCWVAYVTVVEVVSMFMPGFPLPSTPVALLEPFRIANSYGLFAVMTPHRYEIEFQGSDDGQTWTPYPFGYKPQDVRERPRIYAPYQPRFDWNLWFASLQSWQQSPIVPLTEERLLDNDTTALGLFRGNAFQQHGPRYVRAVLWQYWFSTPEEKRTQGVWWRRQYLGTFAPTIEKLPNGKYGEVAAPELAGPPGP